MDKIERRLHAARARGFEEHWSLVLRFRAAARAGRLDAAAVEAAYLRTWAP